MVNNKGKGWHGDSEAHAEVGRKGGQARQDTMQGDPKGSKGGKMHMTDSSGSGSSNSGGSSSSSGGSSGSKPDMDSETQEKYQR